MDIEKELETILEKYDIKTSDNYYLELIRDWIKEHTMGKCVALRGAGEYAKRVIQDFYDVLNLKYIIDANPQQDFMEIPTTAELIPVLDRTQWKDDIDLVIIGSSDFRNEMKQELVQLPVEMIDIQDLLDDFGVHLEYSYYHAPPYVASILLRNLYKNAVHKTEKEKYIKRLIGWNLSSRDMVSVQMWLTEYVEQKFENWKNMELLKNEINELLQNIQLEIKKKNTKDIIWFWEDALTYDLVEYMPFTKQCREMGICFDNAYSPSTWTRSIYSVTFDKEYEIDDCSYKNKNRTQHILTDYLEEKGYECIRIGDHKSTETKSLNDFNFKTEPLITLESSTSLLFWYAIRKLLQSEKPLFLLVHTFWEAHIPVCSPDLPEFDSRYGEFKARFIPENAQKILEISKTACQYLDRQNQFISEILGERTVKIFMSDHGSMLHRQSTRWTRDANHFNFIVFGNNVPKIREKRPFSTYKFLEVMKYVIEEEEKLYDDIVDEYIKIQAVDIYNRTTINALCNLGVPELLYSYRGIITERDRYVLLKNGKEIYNIFPDEYTNYIREEKYRERIDNLRHKAGHKFIVDYGDEKYDAVKLIYEYKSEMK